MKGLLVVSSINHELNVNVYNIVVLEIIMFSQYNEQYILAVIVVIIRNKHNIIHSAGMETLYIRTAV